MVKNVIIAVLLCVIGSMIYSKPYPLSYTAKIIKFEQTRQHMVDWTK